MGSHGSWLLTPRQLYSRLGTPAESQWGCKRDCELTQTPAGEIPVWISVTKTSKHIFARPVCTRRLVRKGTTLTSWEVHLVLFKEKKNCTLHISDCKPFKPVKTHLKPFKAISLNVAQREGVVPACHNILHCHPEQLFPFLTQSGLSSYYTVRKRGGGQGDMAAAAVAAAAEWDRDVQQSNYSAAKRHNRTNYIKSEKWGGTGEHISWHDVRTFQCFWVLLNIYPGWWSGTRSVFPQFALGPGHENHQ